MVVPPGPVTAVSWWTLCVVLALNLVKEPVLARGVPAQLSCPLLYACPRRPPVALRALVLLLTRAQDVKCLLVSLIILTAHVVGTSGMIDVGEWSL